MEAGVDFCGPSSSTVPPDMACEASASRMPSPLSFLRLRATSVVAVAPTQNSGRFSVLGDTYVDGGGVEALSLLAVDECHLRSSRCLMPKDP